MIKNGEKMTTNTTAIYSRIQPNSLLAELPLLATFNMILIACSYLTINIPFSPVPITGQTFGILLVAIALGRVRGTAVVMAYLLEGAMGLPVFAGGSAGIAKFVGPTGGYLVGFAASAYLVGYLADKGWDKNFGKTTIAMVLGTALIFITGLAQLSFFVPSETVLTIGFMPFIPGTIIKIAVASVILPLVWKFINNVK